MVGDRAARQKGLMESMGTRREVLTATNLLLVLIACVSLALYRLGLSANRAGEIVWFICVALGQSILYLVAVWLVLRAPPARSTLLITLILATLFRLSVLFAPPHLSDDIYRYVWDGRVQAAQINPYRYIPADDALLRLRDDAIYPHINRRDYAHTIYPPVAEAIYLVTTRVSESLTWMKATMVLFEAIGCWALMSLLTSFGWPRQRVLIYAWSPLAVWEFAGNGHVDAAAIAFIAVALLAARRRMETATAVALACAALVKLFPVILLPAFLRRGGWKMPVAFVATIIIGYLPYLGVGVKAVLGFLPGYATERGLISGEQFYLLDLARRALHAPGLPNAAFVIFALLALGAIAAWALRPQTQTERIQSPGGQNIEPAKSLEGIGYVVRGLALATAFTILLAPHFPWYFAWLVPFLCFLPAAPLLYLTAASFILYATWLGDAPDQMFMLNSYLYLACALIGAISVWIRRHAWERRVG